MTNPSPYNQKIINEFREHAGVVPSRGAGSMSLLLLTTTGAKSELPRVSPVAFTRDGERFLIIASNAGQDAHPAWYHNLRANPRATVEVGTERFEVIARDTSGEEHTRLYAQMAEKMPGFAEYQRKTHRLIPLLVLERIG